MMRAAFVVLVIGCGGNPAAIDASTGDVVAVHDGTPSDAMGGPDPTFGTNGAVVISRGDNDYAEGFLIEPSGRILFVVGTSIGSGSLTYTMTAFTPAGVVDTTFGTSGNLTVNGGLIGAGPSGTLYFAVGGAVERHLANGALDSTYGTGGVAAPFFRNGDGSAQAVRFNTVSPIVMDPSGRAVFGATLGPPNDGRVVIGRLTANGQPDTTFGTNGNVMLGLGQPRGGFAFQPDGGILVSVLHTELGAFTRLYRVGDTGVMDASYAPPASPSAQPYPCGVAVDTAGRAIIAESDFPNKTAHVERLSSTGAADPSFGGPMMLNTEGGSSAGCSGVAASPAGGFAIAFGRSDPVTDEVTLRLLTVDASAAHQALYDPPGALANQVTFQPDGKIVVSGETVLPNGTTPVHAFLARYVP